MAMGCHERKRTGLREDRCQWTFVSPSTFWPKKPLCKQCDIRSWQVALQCHSLYLPVDNIASDCSGGSKRRRHFERGEREWSKGSYLRIWCRCCSSWWMKRIGKGALSRHNSGWRRGARKGQQGSTVEVQRVMDIWCFTDGTSRRAMQSEGIVLQRVVFIKSRKEGKFCVSYW